VERGSPAPAFLGQNTSTQTLSGGPGQFLVQDHVVAVVGVTTAAVLLIDVDAEQPGPARGQPYVAGHHAIPFPLLVVRRDLLRDEGAHHVTERVVFFGENLALHRLGLPRDRIPEVRPRTYRDRPAYCEAFTSKVIFHI
jgi:hypothetical protein